MLTKPQALAKIVRVWTIENTRDSSEFKKDDTLQVILDQHGDFSHIIHHRPGGVTRNLTPNHTPSCLFNSDGLHIGLEYDSDPFGLSISFDVACDPMEFSYVASDSGGGLPDERGGGH